MMRLGSFFYVYTLLIRRFFSLLCLHELFISIIKIQQAERLEIKSATSTKTSVHANKMQKEEGNISKDSNYLNNLESV